MHRYPTATFGTVAFLTLLSNSVLARQSPVDEVRLGFFQHDSAIIGTRKEKGIDFAFEILSEPLVRSRLLGLPRIVLGGALNSAGQQSAVEWARLCSAALGNCLTSTSCGSVGAQCIADKR